MNHFKTFIFIMILGAYAVPSLTMGQLQRPLKDSEINILNRNIEKNPENIKSRLFLASHYYNLDDWNHVIKYLNPIAEKLPDAEIFKLANAYLQAQDYRQSEAMIGILLSKPEIKTPTYLLAIEIYSKLLEKIENADRKKNLVTALFDTLKIAQKSDPENPKIYDIWLEKLELHITHYAVEALRVMEDMVENKINFKPHHFSLQCKYNYMAELTKPTKVTCQQAIVADPKNPSNYIYLGQTQVNLGEETEGKRMLASVGEKFSSSEEALWATADSYYQSKNIGQAYKYFKKASKHKDVQPRDYLGLAITSFELKKYDEALQAFSKHCYQSRVLHHEFRRASGLLKDQRHWQEQYRKRMLDCKPKGN